MSDLMLKKTMMEIVDNQLKANNPPCTKETYEKLLDAGYSRSEAKDKISEIVRTEIYDMIKKGQSFDREKYKNSLDEMLQQSIDYEDDHHMDTEWDRWDELMHEGYGCFAGQKAEQGGKRMVSAADG